MELGIEIADHLGDNWNELYNRAGTNEPLKKLLEEVNADCVNNHDEVQKVTPELIKKTIKEKIKPNKTDPEFDLMTNGFKHGPDELSNHIATLIKLMLIHGQVSSNLLICAILPLIKNSNGKTDDSGNYRGIGLSALFLKIFDWVVLILYEKELNTDCNQFGSQANSSATLCSWTAIEVINYYKRQGSPVYACLLDYRKAFDLVNQEKMFKLLIKKKISLIFIRLFIVIYLCQRCYVRWQDTRSYSFGATNGTRQGAIFSPKGGFCTYLDPLLDI